MEIELQKKLGVAIALRRKGASMREVARQTGMDHGSASEWVTLLELAGVLPDERPPRLIRNSRRQVVSR